MISLSFQVTVKPLHLETIFPAMVDAACVCINDMKGMEEAIVANWKNKVTFTVGETIAGYTYTAQVVPTGNIKYWRWVSRGTAGKTFGPKTAKALVFPYQGRGNSYIAKTYSATFYGGPGVKVGPVTRFKQVNWPGIKARRFEEGVMLKYNPTFQAKMNAALAQAMTRVAGG